LTVHREELLVGVPDLVIGARELIGILPTGLGHAASGHCHEREEHREEAGAADLGGEWGGVL